LKKTADTATERVDIEVFEDKTLCASKIWNRASRQNNSTYGSFEDEFEILEWYSPDCGIWIE